MRMDKRRHKRSRKKSHKRVNIRYNMDGSHTKTVTHSYKTIFGNTKSYTTSHRSGSGIRIGCGTIFIVLVGIGAIADVIKDTIGPTIRYKTIAFVNRFKTVGIAFAIGLILAAIIFFAWKKRSGWKKEGNDEENIQTDSDNFRNDEREWILRRQAWEEEKSRLNGFADQQYITNKLEPPIVPETISFDQQKESTIMQNDKLINRQHLISEKLSERWGSGKKENEKEVSETEFGEPNQYNAPSVKCLNRRNQSGSFTDEDGNRSQKLENVLRSYDVYARVVHITHGPVHTRFELKLEPGISVLQVERLKSEIMYGMEEASAIIEAPIAGQNLVGVSLPNRQREKVLLGDVLISEEMQNAKSLLTIPMGKDRLGSPVLCDLIKMPHLLVAGQTGSGKTSFIYSAVTSLIYRCSPDEIKLILIDGKGVELKCFNGIPHLPIPVIFAHQKIEAVLQWLVDEIYKRYDIFAERNVRSIESYNAFLAPHEAPMTRFVVIIDSIDDLPLNKKTIDFLIKIASNGRITGIHLIVAAQRPSTNYVVGELKANLPGRVAFKVSSFRDSQIILERAGAEKLAGCGDMLYLQNGINNPIWVQGCWVSHDEVDNVVDSVKEANSSSYDADILDKLEKIYAGNDDNIHENQAGKTDCDHNERFFETAVEYAIADGQISTSTIQRRLKISYSHAGRLIEEMEYYGIIGPKEGSKPRKCIITRETWEQAKKRAGK